MSLCELIVVKMLYCAIREILELSKAIYLFALEEKESVRLKFVRRNIIFLFVLLKNTISISNRNHQLFPRMKF